MSYSTIKLLHLTTVVFTIGFFMLRWYWALYRPALVKRRWVRSLAVVNDISLLSAGITLAVMSRQYPLVASWLTAKLLALIAYILLGSMALKHVGGRPARAVYGVLALASVLYIVAVALTRMPAPWQILF